MYKNLLVKCYEQNLQNDEYLGFIHMMTVNDEMIKRYNLKTITYKSKKSGGKDGKGND